MFYPFGTELTFIRAHGHPIEEYCWHRLNQPLLEPIVISKSSFNWSYDNSDHIEIRTPILKSIKGLKAFYKKLDPVIKRNKLETHFSEIKGDTEYVHDTGGGHVHIAIPQNVWSSEFVCRLVNFLERIYYIRWFFGSFSESDLKYYSSRSTIEPLLNKCPSAIIILSRHNTLEHRYFDAPKNFDQCEDHVMFAQALSNTIYNKRLSDIPYWQYSYKNNIETTIRTFEELIDSLSLNCSRYLKYIDNFREFAKYRTLK